MIFVPHLTVDYFKRTGLRHYRRHCRSTPSFIGSSPIYFDQGVKFQVLEKKALTPFPPKWKMTRFTKEIFISGELGNLKLDIPDGIKINVTEGGEEGQRIMKLALEDEYVKGLGDRQFRYLKSMWGTCNRLINQFIKGVSEGYRLRLTLVGIGYRASVDNGILDMRVGFCHPIFIKVPNDINVEVPFPTRIILSGIDWRRITKFASKIREFRRPEPYKGKGIYVGDETIELKKRKKK